MPALSHESVGEHLGENDPDAFKYFVTAVAAPYYTFCFNLCLEKSGHAKELFIRILQSAIKDPADLQQHVDTWFFRHLHKVWQKFVRYRRDLKERPSDMRFDWSRQLGRQQGEALKILTPLEREVVLFRFVHHFTVRRIEELTGLEAGELLQVFHNAVNRFAHTKIQMQAGE